VTQLCRWSRLWGLSCATFVKKKPENCLFALAQLQVTFFYVVMKHVLNVGATGYSFH
jgi:hypothetical protein